MPAKMKETIATAALTLLINQRVKKLTVKDIVERCGITRQTFYYHFDDIPALFCWMLEQKTEEMVAEIIAKGDGEESLRCFFMTAINIVPYVRQSLDSNYRQELEPLLRKYIQRFFEKIAQCKGYYEHCSVAEVKVIYRYHSLAIFGLLREWTDQDTRQFDRIVHTVYRLMTEGIPPQIK